MDRKNWNTTVPVDLIRTVAIIQVILLHAAIEPWPDIEIMSPQGIQIWWTSNVFVSLSAQAVPLFVILAGSLLLDPDKCNEPLKVFFKKRANRIALPLIFWGIAYFAWRSFVNGESLTPTTMLQGVLAGPYFHFWFMYLILGLYFFTPILRVLVAHANWSTIKYFLLFWFAGTGLIPLLGLSEILFPQTVWFRQTVFLFSGMIGYFLLGAYMFRLRIRPGLLAIILTLSLAWTVFGTYLIVGTLGESLGHFFYDASSFNLIISSIAMFLLIAAIPAESIERRFPRGSRLIKLISKHTLPIYLFHIMVLEVLQKGYLGIKISLTTMNPVVEIPLITAITLIICLAILVPLTKVPYLKRLIG